MRELSQSFDPRQVMKSNEFEVFHYKKSGAEDVQVHHHTFYEVYCFLDGDVEYWVEGSLFRLKKGDLLLINPMELHRPILKSNSKNYERIVLWVDKGYLETLSKDNLDLTKCFDVANPNHKNLLRPDEFKRSAITALLGDLVREFYSETHGNKLCAYGIFLQIMVEIYRMSVLPADNSKQKKEISPLVSGVLNYIAEHFSEELSLEKIASQFFVSKYHLSHEFTNSVGIGLYRYITIKRLVIARQMLADGKSAGETSALCGFKDYTNFFRAFKAEYGISPSGAQKAKIN